MGIEKEQEINRLASDIYSMFRSDSMSRALASMLYGEGYRKASEVESEINKYSKAFEATPLTVSIATNYGTFYVVVVFTKSEGTD